MLGALVRSPVLRLSIAVLVAAMAYQNPVAAAPERCELPPDYRSDIRPDPEGVPTVVRVGILVADVTAIDDVGQAIEGDFIVKKTWRDPRLAGLDGCRFHRSQVWFPVTDLLNSSQLQRSRGMFSTDQVRVGADGLMQYNQRFFGRISTYHQLQAFPFDRQRLALRMAAFEYPSDRVRLELDTGFQGLSERLNIPDWSILGVEASVVEREIPEFDAKYSIAIYEIIAERNTSYYLFKVLLPLALIVMMSFTVFWVNPERFGPQIGLSATSMLTLIAFQFALTAVLPRLGYFTVMDRLIFGSTVLVFLALVEATVTTALERGTARRTWSTGSRRPDSKRRASCQRTPGRCGAFPTCETTERSWLSTVGSALPAGRIFERRMFFSLARRVQPVVCIFSLKGQLLLI
jgi:hypothetical protein